MFIVDKDPHFTHVVKVKVPVDGGFREDSFKTTYRVMPAEEVSAYDLTDGLSSANFLRRVIVGMDELVDANNQPVPYNDDLRDHLLSLTYVRAGISRTYFEAVAGARLGN